MKHCIIEVIVIGSYFGKKKSEIALWMSAHRIFRVSQGMPNREHVDQVHLQMSKP